MTQPLADPALDQLFREARTYNGFLDKPVSEDQLRAIWDLVRMAPTSANSLPGRFVWCTGEDAKERLAALASGNNAPKILAAPVTVIIGMDVNFHESLPEFYPAVPAMKDIMGGLPESVRADMALRNSSLQGAYFIMAARALGLACGPMSGFDNAGVDAAFFADTPNIRSNFISTLGYGDPATLYPRGPRPAFERFNRIA